MRLFNTNLSTLKTIRCSVASVAIAIINQVTIDETNNQTSNKAVILARNITAVFNGSKRPIVVVRLSC